MASDEYRLRDGNLLTWRDNPEGIGRTYYVRLSDAGEELIVWNTAVLHGSVLRAALATEDHLLYIKLTEDNDHD